VLTAEPSPKFQENLLPAPVGTDKSWNTTVLSNWNCGAKFTVITVSTQTMVSSISA
jgi:hypothetical protein